MPSGGGIHAIISQHSSLWYLRDIRTAPDARKTEWMTLAKAKAAIDELRNSDAIKPDDLDAICMFHEIRTAQAFL